MGVLVITIFCISMVEQGQTTKNSSLFSSHLSKSQKNWHRKGVNEKKNLLPFMFLVPPTILMTWLDSVAAANVGFTDTVHRNTVPLCWYSHSSSFSLRLEPIFHCLLPTLLQWPETRAETTHIESIAEYFEVNAPSQCHNRRMIG